MDVIEKAKQRRKELAVEMAKLDEFIIMYESLQGNVEFAWPVTQTALALRTHTREMIRNISSKKEKVETAAEDMLRAQQPLQTAEILQKLYDLGVDVGGETPAINLSSYLSRSDKFVNKRKDGGWFLTEK